MQSAAPLQSSLVALKSSSHSSLMVPASPGLHASWSAGGELHPIGSPQYHLLGLSGSSGMSNISLGFGRANSGAQNGGRNAPQPPHTPQQAPFAALVHTTPAPAMPPAAVSPAAGNVTSPGEDESDDEADDESGEGGGASAHPGASVRDDDRSSFGGGQRKKKRRLTEEQITQLTLARDVKGVTGKKAHTGARLTVAAEIGLPESAVRNWLNNHKKRRGNSGAAAGAAAGMRPVYASAVYPQGAQQHPQPQQMMQPQDASWAMQQQQQQLGGGMAIAPLPSGGAGGGFFVHQQQHFPHSMQPHPLHSGQGGQLLHPLSSFAPDNAYAQPSFHPPPMDPGVFSVSPGNSYASQWGGGPAPLTAPPLMEGYSAEADAAAHAAANAAHAALHLAQQQHHHQQQQQQQQQAQTHADGGGGGVGGEYDQSALSSHNLLAPHAHGHATGQLAVLPSPALHPSSAPFFDHSLSNASGDGLLKPYSRSHSELSNGLLQRGDSIPQASQQPLLSIHPNQRLSQQSQPPQHHQHHHYPQQLQHAPPPPPLPLPQLHFSPPPVDAFHYGLSLEAAARLDDEFDVVPSGMESGGGAHVSPSADPDLPPDRPELVNIRASIASLQAKLTAAFQRARNSQTESESSHCSAAPPAELKAPPTPTSSLFLSASLPLPPTLHRPGSNSSTTSTGSSAFNAAAAQFTSPNSTAAVTIANGTQSSPHTPMQKQASYERYKFHTVPLPDAALPDAALPGDDFDAYTGDRVALIVEKTPPDLENLETSLRKDSLTQ